jgi:catechol 2,3-dioxygenase-like lactoylglutathione lyase family enzyme
MGHVTRFALVPVVLSAAFVLGMRGTVSTQESGMKAARVSHIGMVVRDMDTTLAQYVRVMGFATPKINAYPIPMPDGRKAEFKSATLYMPNFFIELNQPVNDVGPFADHLRAYGMSIQHFGLALTGTGSVDDERGQLEQQGGRWTLGQKGGNYAYVNLQATVGTTVEVNRGGATSGEFPSIPPNGLPPLAALPATHVGFAATDAATSVGAFAKAVGDAPPKMIDYRDAQYPPDSKWNSTAYLRLGFVSHGPIGVEFIESVGGPTPWSDYVQRQKGTAAQHLAINVGDRMDEMIRDLMAKGGKWTNGKPGGNYAYLDFMDTLGLIFELNGTSKSAGGK